MLTALGRWIVVTGAALALAIVVDVPALADTYDHTDARHDVEAYPRSHAPKNRQSDITHLRIVHGGSQGRGERSARGAGPRQGRRRRP